MILRNVSTLQHHCTVSNSEDLELNIHKILGMFVKINIQYFRNPVTVAMYYQF